MQTLNALTDWLLSLNRWEATLLTCSLLGTVWLAGGIFARMFIGDAISMGDRDNE